MTKFKSLLIRCSVISIIVTFMAVSRFQNTERLQNCQIESTTKLKARGKSHFITYGDDRYSKSKRRLVKEAQCFNMFDKITAYGPADISKAFRSKFEKILSLRKGGGYWIWKMDIIENELLKMHEGDYLVYIDAGCSINVGGRNRFREYLELLSTSEYKVLSYPGFGLQEHFYTTEKIFNYFNISKTNYLIRNSGQIAGGILVMQKGNHLMFWLSKVIKALNDDPWMFTDKYNKEAKHIDKQFRDNRHDQSILSVTRKLYGSAFLPSDESYPPNQTNTPFWASRIRN